MEPKDELAGLLQTIATDLDVDVNIYPAPPGVLAVPALVIRPDSPWRSPNSQRELAFGALGERYAVVAVVQAGGDPASLIDQLRTLVRLTEGVDGAWRWTETSGIVQSAEGGIDYLAATVRLTYMEG